MVEQKHLWVEWKKKENSTSRQVKGLPLCLLQNFMNKIAEQGTVVCHKQRLHPYYTTCLIARHLLSVRVSAPTQSKNESNWIKMSAQHATNLGHMNGKVLEE